VTSHKVSKGASKSLDIRKKLHIIYIAHIIQGSTTKNSHRKILDDELVLYAEEALAAKKAHYTMFCHISGPRRVTMKLQARC